MPTLDNEAMRIAILAELARQGIDFATVTPRVYMADEIRYNVHVLTESGIPPHFVDRCRVIRQLADAEAKARENK